MRHPPTLTTKLLAMGSGFLVVAMLSIGLTLWVTWNLEGGAAAVNEAGRLRMNTMRMALALQTETPADLRLRESQFEESLKLLSTGDPSRPLFVPWSDDARTRFADIQREWRQLKSQWSAVPAPPAAQVLAQADTFVQHMDGFVGAIELEIVRWTAVLHLFHLALVGLVIAATVTFMAVGYWVVLSPVARLQQALAHVRQGALGTRLLVESNDEFGQLAAGFNLMAQALQTSHDDLELKVREKTASIEDKNQRLAALYEVSAQAAKASSLETLAQGFVPQVRSISNADAAVMRWSDEGNERYVILATDGLPRAMVEQEQCLHAGSCLCGQPQEKAHARVIPIVPTSAMPLRHCHEAGYATLVAPAGAGVPARFGRAQPVLSHAR